MFLVFCPQLVTHPLVVYGYLTVCHNHLCVFVLRSKALESTAATKFDKQKRHVSLRRQAVYSQAHLTRKF